METKVTTNGFTIVHHSDAPGGQTVMLISVQSPSPLDTANHAAIMRALCAHFENGAGKAEPESLDNKLHAILDTSIEELKISDRAFNGLFKAYKKSNGTMRPQEIRSGFPLVGHLVQLEMQDLRDLAKCDTRTRNEIATAFQVLGVGLGMGRDALRGWTAPLVPERPVPERIL